MPEDNSARNQKLKRSARDASSNKFLNAKISRRQALSTGAAAAIGIGAVVVVAGGIGAYYASRPSSSTSTTASVSSATTTSVSIPSVSSIASTSVATLTTPTVPLTVTSTGTATNTFTGTPVYGGTVTFTLTGSQQDLDNSVMPSGDDAMICYTGLEPILFLDRNLNIDPWLATGYSAASDGLSVTFNIRQGVNFFTLNRPMTAADVAYSLNRIPSSSTAKAFFPTFKSATATGDYTVEVTFSSPYSPFVSAMGIFDVRNNCVYPDMTNAELALVGLTPAQFATEGFSTTIVGTGPFVMTADTIGAGASFSKNPNYWHTDAQGNQEPFLDSVQFVQQTNAATRDQLLLAGQVDIDNTPSTTDIGTLSSTSGITVISEPGRNWYHISGSLNMGPFQNTNVGKAMAYAIDRNDILNLGLNNQGVVTWSPIAVNNPYYTAVQTYQQNVTMAQQLMTGAGYSESNPLTGTLYCFENFPAPAIAPVIQSQLQAAYFDLTINAVDIGTYVSDLSTNQAESNFVENHTVIIHGWTDKVDPWLSICERWQPGGSCFAEAVNPNVTALGLNTLSNEIIGAFTPATKAPPVAMMQQVWVNTPITVPLFFEYAQWAISDKLQNFYSDGTTTYYNWNEMWKSS